MLFTKEITKKITNLVIGLSAIVFLFGFYFAIRHLFFTESREPAAIDRKNLYDFSYLEHGALRTVSVRPLLKEAEVFVKNDEIGISLGRFISQAGLGGQLSACLDFNRVTLIFEAEGIAVGGERPKLIVEAPCLTQNESEILEPIWIPYQEIKSHSPAEGEFQFGSHKDYRYTFKNVSGQWPDQWILSSLKMSKKEDSARVLSLDQKDIYNLSDKPILLRW